MVTEFRKIGKCADNSVARRAVGIGHQPLMSALWCTNGAPHLQRKPKENNSYIVNWYLAHEPVREKQVEDDWMVKSTLAEFCSTNITACLDNFSLLFPWFEWLSPNCNGNLRHSCVCVAKIKSGPRNILTWANPTKKSWSLVRLTAGSLFSSPFFQTHDW